MGHSVLFAPCLMSKIQGILVKFQYLGPRYDQFCQVRETGGEPPEEIPMNVQWADADLQTGNTSLLEEFASHFIEGKALSPRRFQGYGLKEEFMWLYLWFVQGVVLLRKLNCCVACCYVIFCKLQKKFNSQSEIRLDNAPFTCCHSCDFALQRLFSGDKSTEV